MATNVGVGSVSYGIGVQNRYSAFLDDENGFRSPSLIAATARKRAENVTAKQNKATSNLQNNAKSNSNSLSSGKTANGRISQKNKLQDHQKNGNQTEQKRGQLDGKSTRAAPIGQHHQSANNSVQAPKQITNNRPQGNNNQDSTANNNNKSSRNHQNSNYNHQSNVSHQQASFPSSNNNKENNGHYQQQGKYVPRNNFANQRTRRPYFTDDKKNAVQNLEDGTPFIGAQSNEEEKRRRQQKRALDLKHKDPEKRESRRPQVASDDPSTNASNNQVDLAQGELNAGQKVGPRNRRQVGDGNKNGDDATRPSYRSAQTAGGARGRGRREPGVSGEMTGERRDGQPISRGPRGDRPQRNRNGFGSGSRGSRGSKGDEHGRFGRDSERQKPIPNISDKFDFPSLAS